jgi:hypothetical protein
MLGELWDSDSDRKHASPHRQIIAALRAHGMSHPGGGCGDDFGARLLSSQGSSSLPGFSCVRF